MRKVNHLNEGWYVKPYHLSDMESFEIETAELISIPHNAFDLPYHYFDESMT